MAFDPNEWEVVGQASPAPQQRFDPSEWEVVGQQQDPQPQTDESFWGRFKNNTVAAANAAFPFADEAAAALRAGYNYLSTTPYIGAVLPDRQGSLDQELQAIRQGEKDYAKVHPYSSAASTGVGILTSAPFLPSGIAGRATLAGKAAQASAEGLAYGAFQGYGNAEGGVDNRIAAAEDSAMMGALISPAVVGTLGGAAKLLGAGAEKVRPPTQAEEAAANLKLTGGDYSRAAKWKGQGAMGDALSIAQREGVLTGDTAPGAVASRNQDTINRMAGDVSGYLKEADTALTQPVQQNLVQSVLAPGSLKETEDLISKEIYNKPELKAQLARRLQAINDAWDGTVSGLNEMKRGLGKAWKQGDSGELDRALYSDLKNIIETHADTLAPNVAGKVRSTNSDISKLIELQTAARRAANNAAAAETRAPKAWGLTSLPVMGSGGYIGSAVSGNPAVFASMLAMAGTKAALNSRAGASALSSLLKAGSGVSSIASRAGDPRIVGALVGGHRSSEDRPPAQYPEQPTAAPEARRTLSRILVSQAPQSPKTNQSSGYPYAPPISYKPTATTSGDQAARSYQDMVAQIEPALVQVESGGNPLAESPKGAIGTHQVTPIAARDVMRAEGIDDSRFSDAQIKQLLRQDGMSAYFGRKYLALMLSRFGGNAQLAEAAYNGGPSRLDRVGRDIGKMPAETRSYVRKLAGVA